MVLPIWAGAQGLAFHLKYMPTFGASVSPSGTVRASLSLCLLLEYELWPLFPHPIFFFHTCVLNVSPPGKFPAFLISSSEPQCTPVGGQSVGYRRVYCFCHLLEVDGIDSCLQPCGLSAGSRGCHSHSPLSGIRRCSPWVEVSIGTS